LRKNQIEIIKHCGGNIIDISMVEEKLTEDNRSFKTCTSKELEPAKVECKEEYFACAFILATDRNRFGKLIEDLENSNIQEDC
jgi:hypothetical protein